MSPRTPRDEAGRPPRGEAQPPFWVRRSTALRAVVALHVAAAAAVIAELVHPFGADGHGVERVAALDFPASYAVYGFAACVVLVVLGRGLRRLVMRDERYFERER